MVGFHHNHSVVIAMIIHCNVHSHTQAELENLGHIPGVDPSFLRLSSPPTLTPSLSHTTVTTQPSLTVQDIEEKQEGDTVKGESRGEVKFDEEEGSTVLPLVPPSHLLKTSETHPLHIFVS